MRRGVSALGSGTLAVLLAVTATSAGASVVPPKPRKPPASCVRALNGAQALYDTNVQLSNDALAFLQRVEQAAQGHGGGTIEDLSGALNAITLAIGSYAAQVALVQQAYQTDRAACLAGR